MPWGTLTASDIEAHLNAGELEDYRQHCVGQADPLPTIIADVVSLARGYVGARYTCEATGIPDEVRVSAIDLVIHRLAKRVRKAGENDEDRRQAAEEAMRLLRDVAEGNFALPSTEASDTDPRSGSWGSQARFDSPPGTTA